LVEIFVAKDKHFKLVLYQTIPLWMILINEGHFFLSPRFHDRLNTEKVFCSPLFPDQTFLYVKVGGTDRSGFLLPVA
jgi:hypothetical protein